MGSDPPVDPDPNPPGQDSNTDRLSTISENNEEKTRVESKLRVEFTMNGASGPTVNVAAVTKKTMRMLFKADPSMKIKAKTEYEGTIDKLSDFPMTNQQFMKYFEVEEDKWNNRTKVFVGLTVEISTDLENLKHQNRGELMNDLQANNIWLKKHSFKTMKATTIGFQWSILVALIWRPDLERKMRNHLEKQHPGVDIPKFIIQNGRPRVPNFNGKKYSMNALLVICSVDDAEELSTLMMKTTFPQGQCGRFSPIRIKDKSILPRIAMAQNSLEQTAKTVTVLGVHEDSLYGHIKEAGHTIMSDDEELKKETLEEVLMREAVDESGKPMILSIERTIKTDSRGKWTVICGNSDHQERVENYLENNLERLYARSEVQPSEVNYSFGKPRVGGGDLRSVAASYVSALTDLPELTNSDEEQSTASLSRAPKRIKGRSVMVEAGSDQIYAGKPRGDWASKVKADHGTATTITTDGTTGTQSQQNIKNGPASVSSAGQSTLTAQTTQTKQEILLANRLESYKRTTEQQIKELKESMAMLKQKLADTEERMDQQADVLGTIMEQNTLTKDKLDTVETNNEIRLSKLDNNMEIMMAHMGLITQVSRTPTTPVSSPDRKRKSKRKTPVKKAIRDEKPMDTSMDNNSFGVFAEYEDEDRATDEGLTNDQDMLASDDEEEVATIPGDDDSDSSADE